MTKMITIATFLDKCRIDFESSLKATRLIDLNVAPGKALPKTY